jgi:hypothetical protein
VSTLFLSSIVFSTILICILVTWHIYWTRQDCFSY